MKDPFRVRHTGFREPYITRAGTVEDQLGMVKDFDLPQLRAALKVPHVGKVVTKAIGVRIRKLENVTVTCPVCKQPNFTVRGLRAHWCQAKGPSVNSRHSSPLTKEEWQAAVDAARKEAR